MKTDVEISTLNAWFNSAKESSRKKHWEWFVIDQMLRGNQDIRGNYQDNTVEIKRKSDKISFPINKMYATFRAVRGFVTRHKPMVVVEAKNNSEEAKQYARRANKILERDNQLNNYRKINKEWVYYGVKYGLGYRQVGYDPKNQVSIRWSVDPMDLWSGNKEDEIEDAPFIIKTVKRTMGYLKERYGKEAEGVSPDNELAADEYKALGIRINFEQESTNTGIRIDDQTVIIKECWYRVYKPNKFGGFINKCVFVDNKILNHEETPFDEYPFISYKSDIVPNEATGEGHLKHIVAPQRMLNMLNMQLLEYNHLVNNGRYLVDKGSGLSIIINQMGQIIEKNQGKNVTPLPPPPISPTLETQLRLANEFIEVIGGQSDASLGRVPTGITSGKGIEALQYGDSNNIADLRDNFEDALAMEAQWILKMYSLFEKDGIMLTNRVKDEEEDTFMVLGSGAYKAMGKDVPAQQLTDNGDYCGTCAILTDNQVKVSVTSQLGETREARLDLLFKLLDAGIPLKVVLENLEFPNTNDILERIASESLADIAMEQMKQPPQQIPPIPQDQELMGIKQQAQELLG
jgi:hypothetical protein